MNLLIFTKGVDDQLYRDAQDLPLEIKEAQEKKLEELKRQQDIQNRLALERKIFLRYRRIKFFGEYRNFVSFFTANVLVLSTTHCWKCLLIPIVLWPERRKIERRIRRLEKQQRASTGQAQEADISEQLSKLKEDLEYVKVSLGMLCS